MKFPFTYHSEQDHRLLCANMDEQYQLMHLEIWDDLRSHWQPISPENGKYAAYLTDLRQELAKDTLTK